MKLEFYNLGKQVINLKTVCFEFLPQININILKVFHFQNNLFLEECISQIVIPTYTSTYLKLIFF